METIQASPPSEADSNFRMVDVGGKETTRRRAVARGTLLLSERSFLALRDGTNPKGNVLAIAEVAGIQAVKSTSAWIPLCHPLPIEKARLWFEADDTKHAVTVFCEVSCSAKTGVEMEALCGVQAALLTMYDLSKAVDPVLTMTDIRLDLKEGGKQGTWTHPDASKAKSPEAMSLEGVTATVLTVSDRVSRGLMPDRSGPVMARGLVALGARVVHEQVVPDEEDAILASLRREVETDLVFLTGGTGLGPRDVTPEAVSKFCDRLVPGLGEILRSEGSRHTRLSWLSRSVAGIAGNTLIVALPGSPKAVEQGLATLAPLLKHAIEMIRGGGHGKST